MPSFDVVSRINYQEFDNALANCLREIGTRYDFKGLNISIERKDKTITTLAPDNLKLKQVNELLQTHLIRRKVDPRVIKIKNSETATGGTVRQISELKEIDLVSKIYKFHWLTNINSSDRGNCFL